MTVIDFVRMTRANALLILATCVLGVLGAYLYAQRQPVIYQATATAYVVAGQSTSVGESASGLALATQKAASYLPLVNSRSVGERMVAELGYGSSAVAGALSANNPAGSQLFLVTATASTPEDAKLFADVGLRAIAAEALALETANNPPDAKGLSAVTLRPVSEAPMPGGPSSPNVRRLLMLGLGGGLAAGYVISLLRRQLDNRVRHVEDVEKAVGAAVVGIIPMSKDIADQRDGGLDSLGQTKEAFRHIRTNLRFIDVDRPPRSIVVSSPNPGEGKSSVSSNVARVLAESGQPTVIIDADLRRPMLATIFQSDGSLGLTQVLAGDLSVSVAMQPTETDGLHFLPAGRIPPNPSELLGSQRMRALVDDLTRDYFVILDAPPLLPVTDAGLLSAVTDGALLVVSVGKTHKEELALCGKILSQVGGKLLGVVVNKAPKRGMGAVLYGYGYGGYTRTGYYEYKSKDRQLRRFRRKSAPRSRVTSRADRREQEKTPK
ncbi:MAG TPA: polysaccharide biosynthesis tyrosine autokinase [Dermatophilaceae bacterium]|nr:polysaccharide biosynthesis tyrosine autokinase [Dermatophilaceae bacterium]